jgi:hypothetical protein
MTSCSPADNLSTSVSEEPSTLIHKVKILSRDSGRGFGLSIGFIDHFNPQLVTPFNYSTIAYLHTLQNHAKSFPVRSVFINSCLVKASNNGYTFASGLKSPLNGSSLLTDTFLHRLPYKTDLVAPAVFLITSRHGPRRQHRSF